MVSQKEKKKLLCLKAQILWNAHKPFTNVHTLVYVTPAEQHTLILKCESNEHKKRHAFLGEKRHFLEKQGTETTRKCEAQRPHRTRNNFIDYYKCWIFCLICKDQLHPEKQILLPSIKRVAQMEISTVQVVHKCTALCRQIRIWI